MGIIPIPHRTIVIKMKEPEEFRKNFMGKCIFEAGLVGPGKRKQHTGGREAGMAWGSEDPAHAGLFSLKISFEGLRR